MIDVLLSVLLGCLAVGGILEMLVIIVLLARVLRDLGKE